MGALGRFVESGGIATTGISLVREHSERMRPPRALWVPYPLGRPFGVPGDAAFQSAVLRSVLALLEAPSGPVLADYPVELPDASREAEESMPWACPIPLAPAPTGAEPPLAQAFEEELARLLPWYALAVERRGRTTVGLAGLDPRALGAFLAGLLDAPLSLPASEGLAEQLKHAVEDLKALYGEAATAQPRPGDRAPTAVQTRRWFWSETRAGALLRALADRLSSAEDPGVTLVARLMIVPIGAGS